MARPWHPSPTLKAGLAAHAGAVLGIALAPQSWPWALAAVACSHGMVTWGGLWPRSSLLGPNLTRLPAAAAARGEVALTFDDGPDPTVTPAVLALLDRFDVRATFFCIGRVALQHPELVREIATRGHHVENHTQHHPNHFSLLGPAAIEREVGAAQDTLAQLTGRRPRFFRAVAGLRNVFLEPVLARHDLQLATWSHRAFDTRRNNPAAALARLSQRQQGGDILLMHDGHSARTTAGTPLLLDILPPLLEQLRDRQLRPVTLEQACSETVASPAV